MTPVHILPFPKLALKAHAFPGAPIFVGVNLYMVPLGSFSFHKTTRKILEFPECHWWRLLAHCRAFTEIVSADMIFTFQGQQSSFTHLKFNIAPEKVTIPIGK